MSSGIANRRTGAAKAPRWPSGSFVPAITHFYDVILVMISIPGRKTPASYPTFWELRQDPLYVAPQLRGGGGGAFRTCVSIALSPAFSMVRR